jgi:hypothetical protein
VRNDKSYTMADIMFKASQRMFFGGSGVWIQDWVLAMQVLCCLSHASSPFCSGYFWDPVLLYALASLYFTLLFMLPAIARKTGMHHHVCFFLLRWKLTNFLPGLSSNWGPEALTLSHG